jgi:Rad3-related DNA helicase
MAIVHDRENTTKEQIREWQNSPAQLLLSPSMMEGVDLYDDICRFQILLKVPYPYMGDSRVKQLVQEEGQWDWYNQETALNVMQSVGRAVRSKSDYADYYVLDESFKKIMSGVNPPDWIVDAME